MKRVQRVFNNRDFNQWSGVPNIKIKVTGRPLPKGMSPCIVGFVVSRRMAEP